MASTISFLFLASAILIHFLYYRAKIVCGRLEADATLSLLDDEPRLIRSASRPFSLSIDAESPAQAFIQAHQLTDAISTPPEDRGKLVALVSVRNAASTLNTFLTALTPLVDAIIFLDDHSTDTTRRVARTHPAPIELLLTKPGPWKHREELEDRAILLAYGRAVGGTHFLLPDYDEFFHADCTASGLLRATILFLSPGESLVLPWIEAWKSTALQRVLPADASMNFLTRRQTIIFADDGAVSYTPASTHSRALHGNASIHVLRCPRSLCPPPPRYRGPSTPLSDAANVKTLPACPIVELRFLSPDNVILKAAWYEALGRVSGVNDSATRGKMMDAIDVPLQNSRVDGRRVHLAPIPIAALADIDSSGFLAVETWRAAEILRWRAEFGDEFFAGLSAFQTLDFLRLRDVVAGAEARNVEEVNVPRRLGNRTFVLALDDDALKGLSVLAEEVAGIAEGKFLERIWVPGPRLGHGAGGGLSEYEDWQDGLAESIESMFVSSERSVAVCSSIGVEREQVIALVEMLIREWPSLRIVALRLDHRSVADNRAGNDTALIFDGGLASLASLTGNSFKYVNARTNILGSLAGLSVLQQRVFGVIAVDWQKVVLFAEKYHRELSSRPEENMLTDDEAPPVARLLFSLNTGRSGSLYLSRVLETLGPTGFISLHEARCPDNFCSGGGAVRMQETLLSASYQSRRTVKFGMLRLALSNMMEAGGASFRTHSLDLYPGCDNLPTQSRSVLEIGSAEMSRMHVFEDAVYSETNSNFKAWIYDVVLDSLPDVGYSIDVIVLRKYSPAVVKSLYETGYFSNRDGYNWMETCASVNALIPPLDLARGDADLGPHDKLISYVLNAEAVTKHVISTYQHRARFTEVRSEDVYCKTGALALLKKLGLKPNRKTLAIVGLKVDKYSYKDTRKVTGRDAKNNPRGFLRTSLHECEQKVSTYLLRLTEAGSAFPERIASYAVGTPNSN